MEEKLYFSLEDLNTMSKSTLIENLGIVFTQIGKDFLKAEMPVDEKTIQPFKILHGGANLALAETLGGALSASVMNPKNYLVKGMEINANHVRSVPHGNTVFATATFLHRGRNSHIVQIAIRDDEDNLVSISRLTNFIQKREKE